MNRLLPSRRLLASDGRGWQVRELIDGGIHLALGTLRMHVSPANFRHFLSLLEAAYGPLPEQDTVLYYLSTTRFIGYRAARQELIMQFDQFVITIKPPDLAVLMGLCRMAAMAMRDVPDDTDAQLIRDRIN